MIVGPTRLQDNTCAGDVYTASVVGWSRKLDVRIGRSMAGCRLRLCRAHRYVKGSDWNAWMSLRRKLEFWPVLPRLSLWVPTVGDRIPSPCSWAGSIDNTALAIRG